MLLVGLGRVGAELEPPIGEREGRGTARRRGAVRSSSARKRGPRLSLAGRQSVTPKAPVAWKGDRTSASTSRLSLACAGRPRSHNRNGKDHSWASEYQLEPSEGARKVVIFPHFSLCGPSIPSSPIRVNIDRRFRAKKDWTRVAERGCIPIPARAHRRHFPTHVLIRSPSLSLHSCPGCLSQLFPCRGLLSPTGLVPGPVNATYWCL